MACYIGEASIDERKQIGGGQLGNQNGEELRVIGWYAQTSNGRKWDWIARLKDSVPNSANIKKAIGTLMIESCKNLNVGYDQWRRTTFYNQVVANNMQPKNVSVPCATDCSALVACVLLCLGINVSPEMDTRSELGALQATELFDIFYDDKYIKTGDNLQVGDILHMSGHTAICVQNSTTVQPVPEEKKEDQQVGERMYINWQYFESGKEYSDNSGWYIMGGTGKGAYGRYQFQYQYGLVPFMQFCVQHYPNLFSGFQPYIDLGAGNPQLANNSGLHQLFIDYTNNHLAEFSKMQNWCMYNQYYLPLRNAIIQHLGYDVANIGAYAVGTIASLAIRNGANWESNATVLSGTNGQEGEKNYISIVLSRTASKWGSAENDRWLNSQPNRTFSDMDAQSGVVQIGEGSLVDNPQNPAPVNPAGSNAGSAGTPEVKNPTPNTTTNGGIEAGECYNVNWLLKYFTNILPWNNG